jgi:D-arginine dehydrogenase
MRALPSVASLTRLISPAEAAERVPILKPEWTTHALLEDGAQDIEVHSLHQGFLRGIKARGAELFCNSPIQSIQSVGDCWEVVAGGQTFRSARLINAAGAWADEIAQLAGVPSIALEPRRRTALLIDAPAGARDWPMVMDASDTFYFKPDAGRLLVSPADEIPSTPCDAQPDDLDVAIAVDRFEQATTVTVTHVRHRWAGLRNFVADRSPVCGYDPRVTNFFWLAAQGGYGIQTAPALSRVAAALALGQPLPAGIAEFGVRVEDLAVGRANSDTR